MMRNKDKLAKCLCEILDELGEHPSMSMGDVELTHHAVSALFKLQMMDEEGYPTEQGGSYEGGNSYGHYVRGHYSRDGGYSRDGDGGGSYDGYSNRRYSRDDGRMREKLERLMQNMSGRDREVAERMLEQCSR